MDVPSRRAPGLHHPRAERIRVLLVERYKLVRQALKRLLVADCGFHVVGEAADTDAALEGLRRLEPEVVLVSAELGGASGADLARRMLGERPSVRIVGLASDADRRGEAAMREAGAVGFVHPELEPDDFCETVRAAFHWG